MIVMHHLRLGRSIFTVWLLEELGLDYDLRVYHRNPETLRAPPELKSVHPLGKSPVIEVDGVTLTESGAIASFLIETRDTEGKFAPPKTDRAAWATYTRWLHYPEGSAFLPLFLRLVSQRGGQPPGVFEAFAEPEIKLHLTHISEGLGEKPYILGDTLSGADFGLAYICHMAERVGEIGPYPRLQAYVERCQARPAFQRAVEKAVE